MENYFLQIEQKIRENIEKLSEKNFSKLWNDEKTMQNHIEKRIRYGHIKNTQDYIEKIKEAFLNPDEIFLTQIFH